MSEPAPDGAARERAARPILLTVDDDPSVSRAVARDLRRRYGADYRIMRADSGPEALDLIREVVLRGEQVAVILADYRMPRMNGVEFLERAMDLVPQARRALLTAYADTNAAIAAINVVDVDHYLLKPWEPPEEKFYPVVDELLAAWLREGKPAERRTKILGHPWNPASYEVRDFLARNLVPYSWYHVEEADGRRLLAAAGAQASQAPVVITTQGTPLVQPSLTELADAVGLSTTPQAELYDVVIVGAGPAGLGAAVYAASEGLKAVMVERQAGVDHTDDGAGTGGHVPGGLQLGGTRAPLGGGVQVVGLPLAGEQLVGPGVEDLRGRAQLVGQLGELLDGHVLAQLEHLGRVAGLRDGGGRSARGVGLADGLGEDLALFGGGGVLGELHDHPVGGRRGGGRLLGRR